MLLFANIMLGTMDKPYLCHIFALYLDKTSYSSFKPEREELNRCSI